MLYVCRDAREDEMEEKKDPPLLRSNKSYRKLLILGMLLLHVIVTPSNKTHGPESGGRDKTPVGCLC